MKKRNKLYRLVYDNVSKITIIWMLVCITTSVYGFYNKNLSLGIMYAIYAIVMALCLLKFGWLDKNLLVRCYYCNRILINIFALNRRITESPKDIYGIKIKICKHCDNSLNKWRY